MDNELFFILPRNLAETICLFILEIPVKFPTIIEGKRLPGNRFTLFHATPSQPAVGAPSLRNGHPFRMRDVIS